MPSLSRALPALLLCTACAQSAPPASPDAPAVPRALAAATVAPTPPPIEVPVGALLSLTGANAEAGASAKAALETAREDVNAYLEAERADFRFKLEIEDTATRRELAPARLQALHARGAQIVVGPLTSDCLQTALPEAQKREMLLISPTSSMASLAVADDAALRLAPSDARQAEALAGALRARGVKAAAMLFRNDLGGRALMEETRRALRGAGIEDLGGQAYSTSTTGFAESLEILGKAVLPAVARYGPSSVAVGLVSLQEAGPILKQAARMPLFGPVKFFGAYGSAGLRAIAEDPETRRFALDRRFIAATPLSPYTAGQPPAAPAPFQPPFAEVKQRLTARLGHAPMDLAFPAYDALWLAARVRLQLGDFEGLQRTRTAFVQEADTLVGLSGPMGLDRNGDRIASSLGVLGLTPRGASWRVER